MLKMYRIFTLLILLILFESHYEKNLSGYSDQVQQNLGCTTQVGYGFKILDLERRGVSLLYEPVHAKRYKLA